MSLESSIRTLNFQPLTVFFWYGTSKCFIVLCHCPIFMSLLRTHLYHEQDGEMCGIFRKLNWTLYTALLLFIQDTLHAIMYKINILNTKCNYGKPDFQYITLC